jgi:hypothetical protein
VFQVLAPIVVDADTAIEATATLGAEPVRFRCVASTSSRVEPVAVELAPPAGQLAVPISCAYGDGSPLRHQHVVVLVPAVGAQRTWRVGPGPVERSIVHLEPGVYRVTARSDAWAVKDCGVVNVGPEAAPIRVAVPAGGSVRLEVRDRMGRVVPRFRLLTLAGATVTHDASDWRGDLPCVLPDYPPGTYQLALRRNE